MEPAIPRLYLSPHLDDAVLSCGGMIHRQARAGDRVVVVTVCAGAPPAGPLSPYAARLHTRWGMPPESGAEAAAVVAHRRAEDAAALARLGAEGVYLDVPDVIYRRDPFDVPLVDDDAALFGGFHPAEQALADAIAGQLAALPRRLAAPARDLAMPEGRSPALAADDLPRVYVPLGVGGHADHWLVRVAAEAWAAVEPAIQPRLAYYEDYPYSAAPGAIERVIGPGTDQAPGSSDLRSPEDPARAASAAAWRSCPIDLDEADLAAKFDAIGAYASQISSFWADMASMARAVRAFAQGRGTAGGMGERLWVRDGCPDRSGQLQGVPR